MPLPPETPSPSRSPGGRRLIPRLGRAGLVALGGVCAAVGVIGLAVPLLPSTIFFILAAGCFARSSPRLEAWLLSHRWIAEPVTAWRARGAIGRRAKVLASLGMAAGGMAVWAARPPWLVLAAVTVTLLGCAAYVWSRPE